MDKKSGADPIEHDTMYPVRLNKIERLKEKVNCLTDVYCDTDMNPAQLCIQFRGGIASKYLHDLDNSLKR